MSGAGRGVPTSGWAGVDGGAAAAQTRVWSRATLLALGRGCDRGWVIISVRDPGGPLRGVLRYAPGHDHAPKLLACQTGKPWRRCQDWAALFWSAVKNVIRWSSPNAPRTSLSRPGSVRPRFARIAAGSAGSGFAVWAPDAPKWRSRRPL